MYCEESKSATALLVLLYKSNDIPIDRARQSESSQMGLSGGTHCRTNRQMKYSRIPDFYRCLEHFGVMSFVNDRFEHINR